MPTLRLLVSITVLISASLGACAGEGKDDWIVLFNGQDTAGWKLRGEKIVVAKFVDADGKQIAGAKFAKVGGKARS